jgi:hypothetical protein
MINITLPVSTSRSIAVGDIPQYTFFTGQFGTEYGLFYRGYENMQLIRREGDGLTWNLSNVRHAMLDKYQPVNVDITVTNKE